MGYGMYDCFVAKIDRMLGPIRAGLQYVLPSVNASLESEYIVASSHLKSALQERLTKQRSMVAHEILINGPFFFIILPIFTTQRDWYSFVSKIKRIFHASIKNLFEIFVKYFPSVERK